VKSIDELLAEQMVGGEFPTLLRTGVYTTDFGDGNRYEWVHHLQEVKDGKPLYSTGIQMVDRQEREVNDGNI
jgi:hypothetical protein